MIKFERKADLRRFYVDQSVITTLTSNDVYEGRTNKDCDKN